MSANVEGGSQLVRTEVSVGILVCEEIFSIISGSITRSLIMTLTVRKKAQADRKTPREKNEMSLLQISTKEAAGWYRVIGPRMDDRVEVQRWVGGHMWVRIFVHEGRRMGEDYEAVRALLLVFGDRRTRSLRWWSVGFHARKAVEQSTSDSHKMGKGPTLVPVFSGSSHSLRDRVPRRKHRMLPSVDPGLYCTYNRIRSYDLKMALSSL